MSKKITGGKWFWESDKSDNVQNQIVETSNTTAPSKSYISYFTTIPQKNTKMKFHSIIHRNQWAVYPLPFVYLYFENYQ